MSQDPQTPQQGAPQPQPQWVFPEKRKPKVGRAIFVVVLILLVIGAVGGAIWWLFVLPNQDAVDPTPTPTTSTSSPAATGTASASPSATPGATTDPTPAPTATTAPTTAPTPPVDLPDVETFRATVGPWLDDGSQGLDLMTAQPSVAAQIAEGLIIDANNLHDAASPADLTDQWRAAANAYITALEQVSATVKDGGDTTAAIADARTKLLALRDIAGI
ncbi:hypothetical protein [Microbacterium gorillae]|uniref:hypothetical protein n=1 Tax=Microbacterium gorillae TaxID=1231063 RepID=UPI00058FCFC0|nr:hypothetical protein [Microbacterium gorillae]